MINVARLQKTGLPGMARILEVKDTGVTINNNPQVKIMLEVKNSYGQKYNTQCRVLVSRINPNMFMPGMEVAVLIDPKNEQNVVIDYKAGNQQTTTAAATASSLAPPDTAALEAALVQLQKDNDAILQTGKPARAIIKKYTWLGAYINGNNPYAELELEVLPENAAAFSGKARGAFSEASLPKYQPGCEIFVKYDLYDNSKVAIDHS
jgi:citrate lyase gamma subunit